MVAKYAEVCTEVLKLDSISRFDRVCFGKRFLHKRKLRKMIMAFNLFQQLLLLLSRLYDRAVELNSRDGKTRLAFVRCHLC